MSAVDDAKKYLSLRPPMENKTIFALHPDVLVGGLLDEIERLQEALQMLVDEKCDYMKLNLLGDPEQQHTIKIARTALKGNK